MLVDNQVHLDTRADLRLPRSLRNGGGGDEEAGPRMNMTGGGG